MPNETIGPYLTAAIFCEKILEDKDKVLSAIRMIDRVNISFPPSIPGPQAVDLPLTALIAFKGGGARGSFNLKLTVWPPGEEEKLVGEMPVIFEGEDSGASVTAEIRFRMSRPGLYWFGVYLDDRFYTKMLLNVRYLLAAQTGDAASQSGSAE